MDTKDDAFLERICIKENVYRFTILLEKDFPTEIVYIANEAILKVTYLIHLITSNVATAALWFLLIAMQLSEQVYFQVKIVI